MKRQRIGNSTLQQQLRLLQSLINRHVLSGGDLIGAWLPCITMGQLRLHPHLHIHIARILSMLNEHPEKLPPVCELLA